MTPPVLATGALSKKPEKKRVMRVVCMSLAAAVPNVKAAAMKYVTRADHFRPYTSLNGAQIIGPRPNPNIIRLNPEAAVALLTWNCSMTCPMPAE